MRHEHRVFDVRVQIMRDLLVLLILIKESSFRLVVLWFKVQESPRGETFLEPEPLESNLQQPYLSMVLFQSGRHDSFVLDGVKRASGVRNLASDL